MKEKCGNCGAPIKRIKGKGLPENPSSYDRYYAYWGGYWICTEKCGWLKKVD